MDFINAKVQIVGSAPYSQSRYHTEPKLEGEQPDAYDQRTWRHKMTVETINGKKTMVIPAYGMQTCIGNGAKYMKKKIPGQGNTTWAGKFFAGITVPHPGGVLNVDPDTVEAITIMANADGVRGSGKRVPRKFPQIGPGWIAHFNVFVLDPLITEGIFTEVLESAGLFVGVGQFRPEKTGTNGRFTIKSIEWADNRRPVNRARLDRAA